MPDSHRSGADDGSDAVPELGQRDVGAWTVGWVLAGGFLSTFGDCMILVAAPWFVVAQTGSLAAGGVVAAAEACSTVLSGVLGGPLVDRLGSRRPAIYSELAAAVLVGSIPVLFWTWGFSYPAVLLLVTLKALLGAPGATANQRVLPDLAEAAGTDLGRLNSWYWLLQRVGFLLGGPLAGVLIMGLGPPTTFAVAAAVFLSAAVVTAVALSGAMRSRLEPSGLRSEAAGAAGYLGDLVEGIAVIVKDPLLRSVGVAAVLLNLFDSPLVPLLLPALVIRGDDTAGTLGLLVFLFGVGTAAGTAIPALLGSRLPARATVVLSLVVSAVAYATLGRTGRPEVTVTVLGLAAGPLLPILVTLVQRRTPEAILGRVLGTFFACMMATIPLGRLLAGLYLERHALADLTLAAAVAFAVAAVALAWLPGLRTAWRPLDGHFDPDPAVSPGSPVNSKATTCDEGRLPAAAMGADLT